MDDEHGPIPADLALLVEFLNSVDLETAEDGLADPRSFRGWLNTTLAPQPFGKVPTSELSSARSLRNGLRALSAFNAGEPLDHEAVDEGTRALGELPLAFGLVADGSPLAATGTGAAGALAEIAASYHRAAEQRRWPRVKLCASPQCRWAFWDSSNNRSRRWCAMAACGSRAKMRSYRSRARPAR